METTQLFKEENIKSRHTFKGIEYSIFEHDGHIGWSAIIGDKEYGNFIENDGEWTVGKNSLSPEEAIHKNAVQSIDLIA